MREWAENTVEGVDLEPVVDVLETAPVAVAVLYGSYARGEATERSDVDVAVAFEDDLSSRERTKARLSLIERIGERLGIDAVDVVPLADARLALQAELRADGLVIVGSKADAESYVADAGVPSNREARREAFDEVLADLERVV